MDKIEKVSRALCSEGGFDPDEIMANDGPRWKYYEGAARAAIGAMPETDWDDLRGCAPDATGVLTSEAFVRELRDGWRF